MPRGDYIAAAAIDFGTTFSGWAYSFRHDFQNEDKKIIVKNWNSGQHISPKAPTSVLIAPDGETLVAFGYDAEDKYGSLLEEGKHADYYFFQRFKMMLYKQKMIRRNTTLPDATDKRLPAMKVFELVIRYLKDDLLQSSSVKVTNGLQESDLYWTLTVPAIWSERAKQFMREAAVKAGIDNSRLTIVLEPESASIFCRQLNVCRSMEGSPLPLDVGEKYVVVDCGGGTVDICCHEILAGGRLKEVYSVKGDALGGTSVDQAFERFLADLFGEESWAGFKQACYGDYLEFLRDFEVKKRKITPTSDDTFTTQLPNSFVGVHTDKTTKSIKETISTSPYADRVKVTTGNKLRIEPDLCRSVLFDDILLRLSAILKGVFDVCEPVSSKVVLLVGGFGESEMIQHCIREIVAEKALIVPDEAGLAVVKGAVLYGHDTSIIEERVARYTYGKREILDFNDTYHMTEKILYPDGVARVHAFQPLVKFGQAIPADHKVELSTTVPVREEQRDVCIRLYAVDKDDRIPRVVDNPACIKLGRLIVPISDLSVPREERVFRVVINFGSTEISATVIEQSSGRTTEGIFEFLG